MRSFTIYFRFFCQCYIFFQLLMNKCTVSYSEISHHNTIYSLDLHTTNAQKLMFIEIYSEWLLIFLKLIGYYNILVILLYFLISLYINEGCNDNYFRFEILVSSLKQNSLKNKCRSEMIIVFGLEILYHLNKKISLLQ